MKRPVYVDAQMVGSPGRRAPITPTPLGLIDGALQWLTEAMESGDCEWSSFWADATVENLTEARDTLAAKVKPGGWNVTLRGVTFGRWRDKWGNKGWRIARSCSRGNCMWANTPAPSLLWLVREYRRTWDNHRVNCSGRAA